MFKGSKTPTGILLWMLLLSVAAWPARSQVVEPGRGTYPMLEAQFQLPDLQGNPFDYRENDIQVTFARPNGTTARVPAFYDGDTTWRVRFTPDRTGVYEIASITRNGKALSLEGRKLPKFHVDGRSRPGFVRRDPDDRTRFAFDDGKGYYPLGHNVAWGNGKPGDIAGIFDKMGKVGENWSRVWMNHWDGKNLDWVMGKRLPLGTLDLTVAKRWDEIVAAAEKNGIYFQMTLQHHGQYTTRVNPNWNENPWNTQNGGFLATPEEFFTDPQAIALTKAKYRYLLARWGYSPSILAWELFNEVEWTDAISKGHADTVAAWHRDMAAFLREQDPYHHLITTSSNRSIPGLYDAMDYIQPHVYPVNALPAVLLRDTRALGKPIFFGETGPGQNLENDNGAFLHSALWGSLMSESGGAAQYWSWDVVDAKNLYEAFRPAVEFVAKSGLASRPQLHTLAAEAETSERGALTLHPGLGWDTLRQPEITVAHSGAAAGIEGMPAYLQGQAHREMFPAATFHVDYRQEGAFSVEIGQISRAGAHVVVSVDGKPASDQAFPLADRDTDVHAVITAPVPAGAHTVTVANTGADWVVVRGFTLTHYAPVLAALAKGNTNYAVFWVYRREGGTESSAQGKVTLKGLDPGSYQVAWWDTHEGKLLHRQKVQVSPEGALTVETPPIAGDVAAIVTP